MIATAVSPMADPISARRANSSPRSWRTTESGCSRMTANSQAEIMNVARPPASIKYKRQCDRRADIIERLRSTTQMFSHRNDSRAAQLCAERSPDPLSAGGASRRHSKPALAHRRGDRGLGFEDLRYRAQACIGEVIFKSTQEASAMRHMCGTVPKRAQVGADKGAQQPRPNGALMIRAVSLYDSASIVRQVARIFWGESSQAERSEQSRLRCPHHRDPFGRRKQREWQAHRKELIRA